jgi:hypothetical protein
MFIEHTRIAITGRHYASEALQSDWNAARFAIRPQNGNMVWFYDASDTIEAAAIERLRRIFVLADSQGRVLQHSKPYEQLSLPLPPMTKGELSIWESTSPSDSNRYLLCTGEMVAENGERYQLTVGRRLD